jgi:hypothetical protein
MLHFLDIILKFRIILMFVIIVLWTIYHAYYVDMFMIYLHMPSSNDSVAIVVEPEVKNIPHDGHVLILHFTKIQPQQFFIPFQDLLLYIISVPYIKYR